MYKDPQTTLLNNLLMFWAILIQAKWRLVHDMFTTDLFLWNNKFPYNVTLEQHQWKSTKSIYSLRSPFLIIKYEEHKSRQGKVCMQQVYVEWTRIYHIGGVMVLNAIFNNYFSYIVAVSFIGGGNQSTWRKTPTCRKSLTNFIT